MNRMNKILNYTDGLLNAAGKAEVKRYLAKCW